MSDLKSRLITAAEAWAAANGDAPLSRLAKAVANDAKFFDRIAAGGGVNLATLENFGAYFLDAANWPEGEVPEDVRAFAHVVTGSPATATESAGNACDLSPTEKAA